MPEDTTAYEETMPTVDEQEILQEDFVMARVPVEVVEAVTGYILPNRYGQTGTESVSTAGLEILSANKKRAKAVLVATDGAMLVAAGNCAFSVWPQNEPYYVTHAVSIKAKAVTGSVTVGWTAEYWSD